MARQTAVVFSSIALSLGAHSFNPSSRVEAAQTSPGETLHHSDRLQQVRLGQELVDTGCLGEQVSAVQRLLNAHGARPQLAIDEKFGPATRRAVKEFQRTHSTPDGKPLAVDGVVGQRTLAALEVSAPPKGSIPQGKVLKSPAPANGALEEVMRQIRLLAPGDRDEAVRQCKEYLNNAGATPRLKLDPLYSNAMERAVLAFQKGWNAERRFMPELHLPEDGVIRSRTLEALAEKGQKSVLGSALGEIGNAVSGRASGGTSPADHSTFQAALKLVLHFEGGISRDPHDRGNRGGTATNQGITQLTYDRYRDDHNVARRPVTTMSPGERDQIYYQYYWKASRCDEMPRNLAILCFNASVNMGKGASARLLRSAMGLSSGPDFTDRTMAAIREYDSPALAEHFASLVEQRYRQIAECGGNQRYLQGWLRRLSSTCVAAGIRSRSIPMVALTEPAAGEDFGPSLAEGIMEVQRTRGLKVTGELDSQTEAALGMR